MPRYRLTSIGGEKLSPRSRETDTNVASGPEATNEFQEIAKVPSGETATEGAEALDTSGGETAVTDGHVTPPSWDAPTVTYAHVPLLAVRKTTVTFSCNTATLGVVAVAPEETVTGGLHVLPPSADRTTRRVPEGSTTPHVDSARGGVRRNRYASSEIDERHNRQPRNPLVDRSQDRDFTRRLVRVDDVGGPTAPDGNAGPSDIAVRVVEAGAQVDGDGISEGPAPVERAPDLEVCRRRTVTPEDVDRFVIGAGQVSVDGDSRVESSRDVQVN